MTADDGIHGSLASRLRKARIDRHLTQREIAARLGVSTSAVTLWETGRATPRMQRLDRLAEVLDVGVDELLGDRIRESAEQLAPAIVSLSANGKIGTVEVPLSVLRTHPETRAFSMRDDAMDKVIPPGAVVVYDPALPPATGQIVVVDLGDGEPTARRCYRGQDNVLLVPESHGHHDDIVLTGDGKPVIFGTVVWYQAPGLLA